MYNTRFYKRSTNSLSQLFLCIPPRFDAQHKFQLQFLAKFVGRRVQFELLDNV